MDTLYAGSHRFNALRKDGKMLRMEQNALFKGNAKWECTVQR
jgi:hypothetical protein